MSSELVYNTIKVGGPVGSWVVNNPKTATAAGVTIVGGYLLYYFTHQEYPAPWLDRRELRHGFWNHITPLIYKNANQQM